MKIAAEKMATAIKRNLPEKVQNRDVKLHMHYDTFTKCRKDLKDQGYAFQMGDTLFGFEMCLESDQYAPGEIAVAHKSRFVDRFTLDQVSVKPTPATEPVEEESDDEIPEERILREE